MKVVAILLRAYFNNFETTSYRLFVLIPLPSLPLIFAIPNGYLHFFFRIKVINIHSLSPKLTRIFKLDQRFRSPQWFVFSKRVINIYTWSRVHGLSMQHRKFLENLWFQRYLGSPTNKLFFKYAIGSLDVLSSLWLHVFGA